LVIDDDSASLVHLDTNSIELEALGNGTSTNSN
jgi:hypothetical protein